jgi:hypothetical protein
MIQLARLLPPAIALLVSLVSLRMAVKGLTATSWLPFHESAAGSGWDALTPRLRSLLRFLVKTVGLGFLVLFLLLAALPAYLAWRPEPFVGFAVLGVGAVYCLGLGVLTWRLHRETGAVTPWKGSFTAGSLLVVAALLAIATR